MTSHRASHPRRKPVALYVAIILAMVLSLAPQVIPGVQTPTAEAHNLQTKMVYMFFDPNTQTMLDTRIASPGWTPPTPLLQVNDELGIIIKVVPKDGTATGVGGHVDFYVPNGTTVIDAAYLLPGDANPGDGISGYDKVPMKGQSLIADRRRADRRQDHHPADRPGDGRPERAGLLDRSGRGRHGPAPRHHRRRLRRHRHLLLHGPRHLLRLLAALHRRPGQDLRPGGPARRHRQDDHQQLGRRVRALQQVGRRADVRLGCQGHDLHRTGRATAPIVDYGDGRGNAPWGFASGVGGPQSGYGWNFDWDEWAASPKTAADMRNAMGNDEVGPWKRIRYTGSRIASDQPGLPARRWASPRLTAARWAVPSAPAPRCRPRPRKATPPAPRPSAGLWASSPPGARVRLGEDQGQQRGSHRQRRRLSGLQRRHLRRRRRRRQTTARTTCGATTSPAGPPGTAVWPWASPPPRTWSRSATPTSTRSRCTTPAPPPTSPTSWSRTPCPPACSSSAPSRPRASGPNPLVWNVPSAQSSGEMFEALVTVKATGTGRVGKHVVRRRAWNEFRPVRRRGHDVGLVSHAQAGQDGRRHHGGARQPGAVHHPDRQHRQRPHRQPDHRAGLPAHRLHLYEQGPGDHQRRQRDRPRRRSTPAPLARRCSPCRARSTPARA